MSLWEKATELRFLSKEKPGGILTIYLDTDRRKPEQHRGKWKVTLKNGLKKLEQYLFVQGADEEIKHLQKLSKKVIKEIHNLQRKHQQGLVLIASHDLTVWELHLLQISVENEFYWDQTPHLEQLDELMKRFPPCGVLFASKYRLKIIDVSLGEIIHSLDFNWQHNDSERQENQAKDATIFTEFKTIIPTIQRLSKQCHWQGYYLIGDTSVADYVQSSLNNLPVIKVVTKNIKMDNNQDFLQSIL